MNFLDLFERDALVGAHRGNRSCAPENTLSALRAALGKCDFMEIDVQLSRDGIPVIMHDDTLGRTSDVSDVEAFAPRAPWRVEEFTLAELETLDYGSWFYRDDPFGEVKAGRAEMSGERREGLLTLEGALRFAKEESLFLNVEIKDMHGSFADGEVVETVLDTIKQTQTAPLVLLSSFYHPYLKLCKRICPVIPTAALQESSHPDDLVAYLKTLDVDAYNPDDAITDRAVVEKVRNGGFYVNVFTVNDPARRKELFSWGVNGVFTDFTVPGSLER